MGGFGQNSVNKLGMIQGEIDSILLKTHSSAMQNINYLSWQRYALSGGPLSLSDLFPSPCLISVYLTHVEFVHVCLGLRPQLHSIEG